MRGRSNTMGFTTALDSCCNVLAPLGVEGQESFVSVAFFLCLDFGQEVPAESDEMMLCSHLLAKCLAPCLFIYKSKHLCWYQLYPRVLDVSNALGKMVLGGCISVHWFLNPVSYYNGLPVNIWSCTNDLYPFCSVVYFEAMYFDTCSSGFPIQDYTVYVQPFVFHIRFSTFGGFWEKYYWNFKGIGRSL